MTDAEAIEMYRKTRDRAEARLRELRPFVEAWLTAHEDENVTLTDLAELEALNGQRDRISHELREATAYLFEALAKRVQLSAAEPSIESSRS